MTPELKQKIIKQKWKRMEAESMLRPQSRVENKYLARLAHATNLPYKGKLDGRRDS